METQAIMAGSSPNLTDLNAMAMESVAVNCEPCRGPKLTGCQQLPGPHAAAFQAAVSDYVANDNCRASLTTLATGKSLTLLLVFTDN